MRAGSALLILSLGTVVVSPAWADVVVLRDGSSVATTKPYVVKGKIAILTRTDGSLVSIPVEEIDEEKIAGRLYTAGLPDPDLLIRTSGEMRVSNFLLWQIAYAEIHVTPVLWPDFRCRHFLEALTEFQRRERRYGGIVEPEHVPPSRTAPRAGPSRSTAAGR